MVEVSILVLVDAALRRDLVLKGEIDDDVSILVLVDAALRQHRLWGRGTLMKIVSILVLVDAALRPVCNYQERGRHNWFQSLF